MGGKASTPPPVDYDAAARTQGAANRETAIAEWQLNNANQVGPDGTRTITRTGPGDTDYTITTALSPAQQALRDQQLKLQSGYLGMGDASLDRVRTALGTGIDTSGLPALSGGPGAGPAMARADMSGIPGLNYGGAQMGGLTRSIMGADPNTRNQVSNSLYDAFSSRFDPQAERDTSALNARIANMGGVTTSRGAQQMQNLLMQNQGDQRRQAMNDAIQRGGEEESRQQQMAATAGQFMNSAEGQRFQEQLANLGQGNSAQGQGVAQMLSTLGFNNQGAQQEHGNAVAGAQLQNQARSQGLQEQTNLRQMPINELMAMLSGTQVNNPQFQAATPTQIQAAPWMQAAQGQAAQNQATAAANASSQNSMMSGIGSIAGAGIMAF